MSWQDDRDAAEWLAEELSIPFELIESGRDEAGWTWAQTADRLEQQYEAHYDHQAGDNVDIFDEDLPDVFNYYHGSE